MNTQSWISQKERYTQMTNKHENLQFANTTNTNKLKWDINFILLDRHNLKKSTLYANGVEGMGMWVVRVLRLVFFFIGTAFLKDNLSI